MVGRIPRPLVIEDGEEHRRVGFVHAKRPEQRNRLAAARPVPDCPWPISWPSRPLAAISRLFHPDASRDSRSFEEPFLSKATP